MPSRKLLLIAAACLQIAVQSLQADTIILKDGVTYTGKIVEQYLEESPEGTVSLQVEGQTRTYWRTRYFSCPESISEPRGRGSSASLRMRATIR